MMRIAVEIVTSPPVRFAIQRRQLRRVLPWAAGA
jgi:hypothetical protein